MAAEGILAPGAAPVRTATNINDTEPSSGGDHRRLAAKIIAGVAAAFALCVILVFVASLYARWRRARRRNVDDDSGSLSSGKKRSLLCSKIEICNSGKLLNDTLSQTPKKHIHFAMRDLSIATNGFDESNILGEGGFGKVYRGVLASAPFSKVAIKVLTGSTTQGVKEFVTEIEVLSRLDHKHLVRLLGSCMVDEQLLLVYRHVANGSLSDHLHGDNGQIQTIFPWHMRVKIALGAALGVQHLHLQHPAVLHRDIKAANILLTRGFNAKVCDFGFAKFSSVMEDPGRFCCTPSRSGAIGTLGYVAPESMMTGEVSSASDVYSFGVVLLELLTGRKPLDFTKPDKEQSLVNWARNLLEQERIHELIDPLISEDLSLTRDSALLFLRMAKLCLDLDCQQRPTIGEVVQTLHVIKAEYESKPESVAITLSESDSASEVTADDTLSEISLGSDEDTNLVDIHDSDVDSFELHRSVKQFSSRYLDSDDCEGGFVTRGGFSKSVRRCSSTPFTRPLSSSSWLSLGASSKPATPPRG